jgi:hypothetical protein
MRNFSGTMGIGVAFAAGMLAIAMPVQAVASPAAAPSPRAEFPAISATEIRNDTPTERYQPPIPQADQDMYAIVACAIVPPIVEADARPGRAGAGRVGNAGGRATK